MSTWIEGVLAFFDRVDDPYHDLPSEDECRRLLASIRFGHGFTCPRCGCPAPSPSSTTCTWRCSDCGKRTSLTANTVFHRTKLPLRVWLAAIWYATKSENGIAALRFQRRFGLKSYVAVWRMMHKVRDLFAGDRRQNVDGAPSSATLQVLGRHRKHVATSVRVDVGADALRVRVMHGAHKNGGGSVAQLLLESFRTCINGTYHGVSPQHLHRYASEMFGRWRDARCCIDVLRAALHGRARPAAFA